MDYFKELKENNEDNDVCFSISTFMYFQSIFIEDNLLYTSMLLNLIMIYTFVVADKTHQMITK